MENAPTFTSAKEKSQGIINKLITRLKDEFSKEDIKKEISNIMAPIYEITREELTTKITPIYNKIILSYMIIVILLTIIVILLILIVVSKHKNNI